MISPRWLLLLLVGCTVVPLLGIAVAVPDYAPLCLPGLGALALFIGIDAMSAWRSVYGIRAEISEVVRLTKDREGTIEILFHNSSAFSKRLDVALQLPRELQSEEEMMAMSMSISPNTLVSRMEWPVTPLKRGNYDLDAVYFQGISPFGFWGFRTSSPIKSQVRVYPNVLGERRYLAALFLPRGVFGIHAQRQVGKGRDFEKLREYIPGDGYDEIHWKATAKRGRPVTKVFQLERTQEVYVILDASRLSARTVFIPKWRENMLETPDEDDVVEVSHLERFITAALVVGTAAERQGDHFGVLTYGDRVRSFVRAKSGRAHYSACRDSLYVLEPELVNPDFDEVFSFLRLRLRRRSLLVFLTNLDDPVLAESFVRNVEIIRRQHLILVGMITPPAVQPVFTDAVPISVDDVYSDLAGHLRWHDLRELERVLHRQGVTFQLLENERMCAELVTQYTSIKRRQLI